MQQKEIKLPLAVSSWDEEEVDALKEVIKGNSFTMGEKVKIFEEEFAKYHNSKFCIMVNSGSSANHLAISSLLFRQEGPNLKPGDEVLVPAVSWSTTYSPLFYHGMKLRFVDIDMNTLNVDLDQLEFSITNDTKAIFSVNLLGNPNNFDRIQEIAKKNNLILIEDNCESLGAEYSGNKTGTFGDIGTCSGFFSHHISTMEGGMILTDEEEIYHILLALRAHGWTRNLPKKNKLTTKSSDEFEESFKFILPGYNVRPLEMSGVLGQIQLKKLDNFVKQRRENALLFQELFSKFSYLKIQKEIGKSSWFGFSFIIDEKRGLKRKDFLNFLNKEGFESRPIVAGNILRNPMIKYYEHSVFSNLKNSDNLHFNGLFLGNHHFSIAEQLNHLNKVIHNNFGS